MKASTVYFRGGEIYVIASARDVRGILQDSEPFVKLSGTASPQELGAKVLGTRAGAYAVAARKS